MKVKQGYVLRSIADTYVIVPLRGVDMSGMIKLNTSGALLWKTLEQGADLPQLVEQLVNAYDVTPEQAQDDVQEFLQLLSNLGCLEK